MEHVCVLSTYISPWLNTRIRYWYVFKKKLNLKSPKTFNEKILWLKLNRYMNDPLVIQCADKYRVRDYIKEAGCGEYLNDLIGVYNSPEEIIWDNLPRQFVLKWNFGAGANFICKDKNQYDEKEVKSLLEEWGKIKYWIKCSEMQYKYIPPCLICERLLNGNGSEDGIAGEPENWKVPEDYKIYCFHGKAEYVMICKDRFVEEHPTFLFYDREWKEYAFSKEMIGKEHPPVAKPACMDEMFEIAERLSKPFPFVRVDFFEEKGKIIFGELTFTPCAGLDNDLPEEAERILGEKIKLEICGR